MALELLWVYVAVIICLPLAIYDLVSGRWPIVKLHRAVEIRTEGGSRFSEIIISVPEGAFSDALRELNEGVAATP